MYKSRCCTKQNFANCLSFTTLPQKCCPMKFFLTVFVFLSFSGLYAQKTYIQCGLLFNAISGKNNTEKTIVIKGDKILEILDGYQSGSKDDRLIDMRDAWVMPGWIDMHVHIEHEGSKNSYLKRFLDNPADIAMNAVNYAQRTLKAGFTTVRDLGGTGVNVSLSKAIKEGKVVGPRIYTARKAIAISGGHADPTNGMRNDLMGKAGPHDGVADGPEECIKAVRWQTKNGADCIKITATGGVLSVAKDGDGPAFNMDELRAIMQTAADRGVHVAAHAHGKEGMKRAIIAGVKTIEHGTYADQEIFKLLKEHNAWLIPTITAGMSVADSAKIKNYFPDVVQPKAERIGPQILEMFKKAYQAGAPIGFGTDAGVFKHGKNAMEFSYMVAGGMPLLEAVQAATIVNARILKWEDKIGSISKGKLADIVAVPQDALKNPKLMMHPLLVIKNGTIIVPECPK